MKGRSQLLYLPESQSKSESKKGSENLRGRFSLESFVSSLFTVRVWFEGINRERPWNCETEFNTHSILFHLPSL